MMKSYIYLEMKSYLFTILRGVYMSIVLQCLVIMTLGKGSQTFVLTQLSRFNCSKSNDFIPN